MLDSPQLINVRSSDQSIKMTPNQKRLNEMKKHPRLFEVAILELENKLHQNIKANGNNETKKGKACRTQEEACRP